jgi:hypothetical protein
MPSSSSESVRGAVRRVSYAPVEAMENESREPEAAPSPLYLTDRDPDDETDAGEADDRPERIAA